MEKQSPRTEPPTTADDPTKLKIRVGPFGDDSLQATILERVKSNLPRR
jgi:hypothetical protein